MTVLSSSDSLAIAKIRTTMEGATRFEIRGDKQATILVEGRNAGFVTRFKKSGKYHVYLGANTLMFSDARGVYDYLTDKFQTPYFELKAH